MANKKRLELSSDWVTTARMCEVLSCTRQHLQHLRNEKILKLNKHYRNISPQAARPTFRWHEENVQRAIEAFRVSINDRDSPENLTAMRSEE
ncbi:DNA-binding protein [Microcoleus sp. FACHB-1515]|uniref:DNA-binding protein n=1 Tax=Cyanophyceae TaxID=3028117 RepID=UPI001684CDB1|nr:DNA-binding protein [Microcoleus sp. FACHB-1515]MBD2088891.1 DNA-binding protein [Microcoleus sp. FACHB-1515]